MGNGYRIAASCALLLALACQHGPAADDTAADDTADTAADTGTTEPPQQVGTDVVLADGVVEVTEADLAGATIEEDRIVVQSNVAGGLASVRVGDVLVSSARGGILRRVTDVQVTSTDAGQRTLDLLTLLTSPASLLDALTNADFTFTITPDAYDDETRIDDEGLAITFRGTLQTSITVSGKIREGAFSDVVIEFVAQEAAQTDYEWTITGAASKQERKTVFDRSTTAMQVIGPVPVVEVIHLGIDIGARLGIEGQASVLYSIACNGALHKSAAYGDTGWVQSDFQLTSNCTESEPALEVQGNVVAGMFLAPRLDIKFYGVAGPYLSGEIGGRTTADLCPGGLRTEAYWSGELGFDATPLGVGEVMSVELGAGTLGIAELPLELCAGAWLPGEYARTCAEDACVPCGHTSQACCDATTPPPAKECEDAGAACLDGACTPCGEIGIACCPGDTAAEQCPDPMGVKQCDGGGQCAVCGIRDQPCCDAIGCIGGLVCASGTCALPSR